MSRSVVMRSRERIGKLTWILSAMLTSTIISTPRSMYGLYQAVASTSATEHARAVEQLLARPVTVDLDRVSLKQALNAVGARAGAQILYRAEVISSYTTPVSLHTKAMPLGATLVQILASTPLQAVPVGGTRIMIVEDPRGKTSQAQGTIVGTVVDAKTKRPLAGAKIVLQGVDRAVTSEDGTFRITGVDAGTYTVTVKLLGYGKTLQTVTIVEGTVVTSNIALELSTNILEQVVVTGTIIPTELKAVPNAITVITAKQIEDRGITKIDQLFRGDVPGLFAMNRGSEKPLDEVTMYSRGVTALSDPSSGTDSYTNPIKTYVDGVELSDPKYLSQLDPKSIERIEILTGPQASTIYGSNAINGVMQIFTKRGSTAQPQLTLNLLSGFVQNNFSSALTPQHDYSAQLSGIEGRFSYNAGGSWNYVGAWTPAKQTARLDNFGGTRLELSTRYGRVITDMTFRRSNTQNKQRGATDQVTTNYVQSGWYVVNATTGLSMPTLYALDGQTLGGTVNYSPTNWWSHDLGFGHDASDNEQRSTARAYRSFRDTTLLLQQTHTERRSLRYTTTAQVPVTSFAHATITVGTDAWQSVALFMQALPQTLTGSLSNTASVTRQPSHNTGGFLQTQLGVLDRFFITYGLRAEWNPNFGEEAEPNYAPRYGVAYTYNIGNVAAKLRASYGRSTRPPQPQDKALRTVIDIGGPASWLQDYGNFSYFMANPELGPEHQQGGEGGVELYLGTRGSFVITRYNQTIDGLIDRPVVDSARSFFPNPPSGANSYDTDGYGYMYERQYLNIGSIRNQGWELQGTLNTGPLTTKGTYSLTKSRTIGIVPKYRSFFSLDNGYPQYQPGASFDFLPEHTWAMGMTYAQAQTTLGFDLTGTGRFTNAQNNFVFQSLSGSIRLPQNRLRMTNGQYIRFNKGYMLTDLTISRRVVSGIEGLVLVQNLTDHYMNDYYAGYATMGRQVKAGVRARL